MKFSITYGLNILSIGLSEVGSYFYFKRPLVTTWREYLSTSGQYLCLLEYDEHYRNKIRNRILLNLDVDYSAKPEELQFFFIPFFKLFPNGEYEMKYYHSSDNSYFKSNSTNNKDTTT